MEKKDFVMDVKRIVKFNCTICLLFITNKFAYLTNILYLLQIIFVVSTEKNKYITLANNLRSLYLQMEFMA